MSFYRFSKAPERNHLKKRYHSRHLWMMNRGTNSHAVVSISLSEILVMFLATCNWSSKLGFTYTKDLADASHSAPRSKALNFRLGSVQVFVPVFLCIKFVCQELVVYQSNCQMDNLPSITAFPRFSIIHSSTRSRI